LRADGSVVTVEILPAELAADEHVVATLVGIVNRAYLVAEEGMWTRALTRTNPGELAEAVAKGEVAAVRVDGELAGSVFTHLLDDRTGWFGALAVDPSFAGRGLGRQLVTFAEEHARRCGADTMQLELLVPDPPHPHTERLAAWYAALNYRDVEDRDLADLDADSVQYAVVPIRVRVMRKSLEVPE
jgi:ribosomal protein S18 acetylase RimI-like enzyme